MVVSKAAKTISKLVVVRRNMNWEDGDFNEELAPSSEYFCPWCKKETDLWFDRTIEVLPVNDYIGLCECGNAVYDLPESDDYSYDVENDGG
jgi:hypothetical protein